jgi:O-antigen ligase
VALAATFMRGAAQWHRPKVQVALIATIALIAVVLAAAWQFAQDKPWLPIAAQAFDDRVTDFGTLVEERSGQWVAGVQLVNDHPFGVGLGLLSHKAAEIDGLLPYAVTDGNLFRLLAETGVPGIALFALLVGIGMARVLVARRLDVAAPLGLLLVGAMGSNVFDLYYIGFVFWLLLGIALSVPMHPPAPQPGAA